LKVNVTTVNQNPSDIAKKLHITYKSCLFSAKNVLFKQILFRIAVEEGDKSAGKERISPWAE